MIVIDLNWPSKNVSKISQEHHCPQQYITKIKSFHAFKIARSISSFS